MDADGTQDVVVGDPATSSGGTTGLRIYSGADGGILWNIVGDYAAENRLGVYVSGLGDVDRDGHDDVLFRRGGLSLPREVVVFSGATGADLFTFGTIDSWEYSLFGYGLCSLGDVDADGYPDFAYGAPVACCEPGSAFVRSGRDGSILHRFDGFGYGGGTGATGDVNLDGFADFFVLRSGVGTVYSGCDGSWTSFGQGCPGTNGVVPALSVRGCPTPGRRIYLAIEDGLPGAEARLFVGSWQASLLGGDPCPLLVEPVMLHPVRPGFPSTTLAADGSGEIAFKIPNGLAPGTTYTAQVRITDPASPTGYSATQGVEITVR